MKKNLLVVFATTLGLTAIAQPAKVTTAYKYMKDYERDKGVDDLMSAKAAIDLANENPETKDLAKTQVYRGQIYLYIFENNLKVNTEKETSTPDPKKKEAAGYQNTALTELDAAYDAYVRAKAADTKGNYSTETGNGISRISVYYTNKGSYDYNGKKFLESMASFEKAYQIGGMKDTNLLYNCALTADRGGNYDKAKEYYGKMIENKQGQANTYSLLQNVYLMAKDTAGSIEILKKGRAAYPNDINLLISETNFYLKTNNSKEALNNLNLAIAAKPGDANLYLVRGNIYDNLANPKDADGKDLEKPKDYEDKLKLAETDYQKAIELKPDYFDAMPLDGGVTAGAQ